MMTKEGSTKILLISQPPWQEVSVVSDTRMTVKACGSLVRKMLSWYKAWQWISICYYVKRLVVSCDGWRCMPSTARNEDANGAHNKDPLTDEAAMSSELWISFIFCVAWFNQYGIFFRRRVSESWYNKIQLEGRRRKRSTPRTSMQWRTTSTPRISTATLGSFREVSKYSISNCISYR